MVGVTVAGVVMVTDWSSWKKLSWNRIFVVRALTYWSKAWRKCNSRSEFVWVCGMDSMMISHAVVEDRDIAGAWERAEWKSSTSCTKLKTIKFRAWIDETPIISMCCLIQVWERYNARKSASWTLNRMLNNIVKEDNKIFHGRSSLMEEVENERGEIFPRKVSIRLQWPIRPEWFVEDTLQIHADRIHN